MADCKPSKDAILLIAAAKSAHKIHTILTSHGMELAIDVIQFIMGVKNDIDKACLIERAARHGGLTLDNIGRYIGTVKTNRCSECRWLGHTAPNCPGMD